MTCVAVGTWLMTDWKRAKKDRGDVEFAAVEPVEDVLRDLGGVGIADALDLAEVDMTHEKTPRNRA